jgi:hypothetical protein
MQMTAHRLASLWTSVRIQLRDSRDTHAAQAAFEQELTSYHAPKVLDGLSNVMCHRI